MTASFLIIYGVIGLGVTMSADEHSYCWRVVLFLFWPLIFGLWLGERWQENALRHHGRRATSEER